MARRRQLCRCRWPRNVWLNIAFSALSSAAASLSSSAFFSNYLVALPNQSEETVGFVFAASGVTMVLLAWPVGVLTDRLPRSTLLRASAAAGVAAAAALLAALAARALPLFYLAAVASGAFSAISGPVLAASFADALPAGERTAALTALQAASLVGAALGPLLGAAAFLSTGDTWAQDTLAAIMAAGAALSAASCALLLLLRDGGAGGASGAGGAGAGDAGASLNADTRDAPLLAGGDGGGEAGGSGGGASGAEAAPGAAVGLVAQTLALPLCGVRLTVRAIPYLIFASDMIIAMGAGMTIAFFPLYFARELRLPPDAVAFIFAASPLLVAAACAGALPLARACGRARAAVLLDAVGTGCILIMALAPLPPALAVGFYLLRTAAMNAGYPVQRAILFDVVAKADRGKWASLENLTSCTWTGSAALGGLLVQRYDYSFTFLITGVIYTVGTLPLVLLVPLTAGERVDGAGAAPGNAAQQKDGLWSIGDAAELGTSG